MSGLETAPNFEVPHSAVLHTVDRTGVLVVTLDRPPANALNRQLIRDLTSLFGKLAIDQDPPPIVLTGQGSHFFSAGGDIKELDGVAQQELDNRMRDFQALLVAMDRYPRPVVSAINGHCVGGGLEIALFADTLFSVPEARFGFPEINHGLLPADKGIQRAVRLLGVHATRRILLSGILFDAAHANEIGLVDHVVGPDELVDAAITSAREAGMKVPVLYEALKRSVNDPDDTRDEVSLLRTIASAAEYFDDPAARALREAWTASRRAKSRG